MESLKSSTKYFNSCKSHQINSNVDIISKPKFHSIYPYGWCKERDVDWYRELNRQNRNKGSWSLALSWTSVNISTWYYTFSLTLVMPCSHVAIFSPTKLSAQYYFVLENRISSWMGSAPILPDKVTKTVNTMLWYYRFDVFVVNIGVKLSIKGPANKA